MKEKLAKLIDVKTIVTLVFTLVISYLGITGRVSEQSMVDIFKTIIIFYFGTQAVKKSVEKTSDGK